MRCQIFQLTLSNWLYDRQPKRNYKLCAPSFVLWCVKWISIYKSLLNISQVLYQFPCWWHKFFTAKVSPFSAKLCVWGISASPSAASGCDFTPRKICCWIFFEKKKVNLTAKIIFLRLLAVEDFTWLLQFYQNFMELLFYRQKKSKIKSFTTLCARLWDYITSLQVIYFYGLFCCFCMENT